MSLRLVQTLKQYRHDGQRWQFVFPKEPKRKGTCKVIRCRRPARVEIIQERGKLRTSHRSVCDTCACRLWRANNVARDAYRIIRDRALRRNQIFDLTFEQFMAIPRIDEYLARRGRAIDELHLDRVKVERGYVPGNLQVLTTAQNIRKRNETDYAGKYVKGPF